MHEELIGVDGNGAIVERRMLAGVEVLVHYDDVPESDITVVDGIPCTTALRTVIDLAPELDGEHLRAIVEDGLRRRLFTVEEAIARIEQPDMTRRLGAQLLRRVLLG